jgi:hypothetical protein
MVYSNGSDNGNGEEDAEIEVAYEYIDSDVWIETSSDGSQDVAYTEDVLDALGIEEESEESDNN